MSSCCEARPTSRRQAIKEKCIKECALMGVREYEMNEGEAECKDWYHRWIKYYNSGSRNNTLPKPAPIPYSDERNLESNNNSQKDPDELKTEMLGILKQDRFLKPEENPRFMQILSELESIYKGWRVDARHENEYNDANWFTVSPYNYAECLGMNSYGDELYTLGRMSFGMYRPTDLICSIQWVFNPVIETDCDGPSHMYCRPTPKVIREEVMKGRGYKLRHYDISTAFTIEDEGTLSSDDGDVDTDLTRGLMTTFGYILPDPNIPNRFSVWFTGGVLEEVPNKSQKRSFPSQKWKDTFQSILSRPSFTDIAKQISARFMLGIKVPSYMDEVDGSMQFQFIDRPVGGHGNAYVDVLYLDQNFRILRGHHGSIYVSIRFDVMDIQP